MERIKKLNNGHGKTKGCRVIDRSDRCHAVQKCTRNRCTATCILNLGRRQRWVASSLAQPLYPQGNRPRYPMNYRLDVPQDQFWYCRKEKHLLSLPQTEPQFLMVPSPEPNCKTEWATYINTFKYLIWIHVQCILTSLSHNQALTLWFSTNIGWACFLLFSGYFLGLLCPWRWWQYIPLKCQLMLRSRECGSIHPLPHMPSWHSS
jgi:hypothetical protein